MKPKASKKLRRDVEQVFSAHARLIKTGDNPMDRWPELTRKINHVLRRHGRPELAPELAPP
jgi:hypothetical protein